MLVKNARITLRNPKNLVFLLVAPVLVCIFLMGFQQLASNSFRQEVLEHPLMELSELPRCGSDCHYRLGIVRLGPSRPWTEHLEA
jgi:hypothetical protein